MIVAANERCLLNNRRRTPHFLKDLSSDISKKVGDFNKKEFESLMFSGLKILRDYYRL